MSSPSSTHHLTPVQRRAAPATAVVDLRVRIPAGAAWSLRRRGTWLVLVEAGPAWITPGDGRDVVLATGASMRARRGRHPLVVCALAGEVVLALRQERAR